MNKLFKTEAMKRLKKSVKSKRGTTLIEMIATVAILAIIASLSFEAMFMASEEFRRVEAISEAERSISLLQDNLNMYAKNSTGIKFVDNSDDSKYASYTDVDDAIRAYIYNASLPGNEPMQDAENNPANEYIDLFLYRSGDFTYTIGKYVRGSDEPKKIVEVSNIKEINLSIKKLNSSFSNGATDASYLFDYAVVSPTGFEMLYSKKDTVVSGDVIDSSKYSNNDGSYSVMTGTVLNNIESNTKVTTGSLRMSENTDALGVTGGYKGDLNFVVIRTVPREAK